MTDHRIFCAAMTWQNSSVIRLGVLISLLATPLFAHHGKDFLLVESYELPHPRTLYAVSAEELLFGRSSLTFRDEPSLLFGLSDRVAAEIHAHIEKEPRRSADVAAIAPAVHLRLIDSDAMHAGLSAEYEIGRHGIGNAAAVRLILGRSFGESAVVGNIGVERAHGESTRAIYAIGYRPDLEARQSWGIEAQGALRHGEQHEAIVAGYLQISDRLNVKAGVGAALGTGKPLALIRTGVVWRF
jgi:hypothetical protein